MKENVYNMVSKIEYGKTVGEPRQTSGQQELYEAIVAMYMQ